MRRIDELKKEIIHEILNSEEYREYRRLQNEIDRIPDLKRQITFCRYMSDIFKDIAEVIDVDLDFLG